MLKPQENVALTKRLLICCEISN
uniref:Uncharacterized protein n=1 Tax=Nelumbo nucifera TaxID=4432 RepID=A0A822YSR9_NELNU|nr:TPA_asm: hypothetical protein HUJ06_005119 [Nelumbo nucifera]